MSDLIWLEVQAWHTGKTVEEEDRYMCKARKRAPLVFEKVYNFKAMPLKDLSPTIVKEPNFALNSERQEIESPSETSEEIPAQTPDSGKLNEAINEFKVGLIASGRSS